jgi:hypothetical protein
MWFQYWLVLFSCWACSNMMGLVISDSFKAVVTIYILIPFLVIPNIILSGVMVKYEKLNPNLSSPVAIPFYGEIWPARWGYEALAVEQFVNNKFEKEFYRYDQAASQAQYYRDYWVTDLTSKLDIISNSLEKIADNTSLQKDLEVVNYEVNKYLRTKPDSLYRYAGYLTPGKINSDVIAGTKDYLKQVKSYNIRVYRWATDTKDNLKEKMKAADNNKFLDLQFDNTNKKLEEFVKARGETDQILTYNGRLYQKMDPIFRYPEHPFIKAHFYAPVKNIFGKPVDTYIVNVIVLWMMTILLYLALYFRLLKKTLDSGETLMGKGKGSD